MKITRLVVGSIVLTGLVAAHATAQAPPGKLRLSDVKERVESLSDLGPGGKVRNAETPSDVEPEGPRQLPHGSSEGGTSGKKTEPQRTAPPGSAMMPPQHIEFEVQRVENPKGSRVILLTFERDKNYGLGLEFSQDMTVGPDGKVPKKGYRDFRQKTFIGVNGANQFSWQLPEEFTEDEARAVAQDVENRAFLMSELDDGALIEFANVKHRDGWTYHLVARVKRECGAPHPPAPPGAVYAFEKLVNVPNDRTVKLKLFIGMNDQVPQPVGEPLYFKTPRDRATGILLRGHAYDGSENPGNREVPSRVLLDLIDPDTGVTYHRFQHGFGTGVSFRILDAAPLPDRNSSVMLAQPGRSTTLRLLAAQKVAPLGAGIGIPDQWQLLAEVAEVNRDEANAAVPVGTGRWISASRAEANAKECHG